MLLQHRSPSGPGNETGSGLKRKGNENGGIPKNAAAPNTSNPELILERHAKRHLNLSRAADCFGDLAEPAGRVKKGVPKLGACRAELLWLEEGHTFDGECAECQVLRDVVDRNVEAGRVRQVEDVEAVLQRNLLRQLCRLQDRDIRNPLPRLPEDVALARGEIRFKHIACWIVR